MNTGRYWHATTLLSNGNVLVTGGFTNNIYLASCEVYSPTAGTWTMTGGLLTRRRSHTTTLLSNGKVLAAGGQNSDEKTAVASAELYDPSGTWMETGKLLTARWYHTATLLPNGKVLVAGGEDSDENPIASAELYDPVVGSWSATCAMTAARDRHTATLLPNGQVLVAGGRDDTGSLSSAELYDPATGAWTATTPLNIARYEHTATLLPSGKVLVAGGVQNAPGSVPNAELYDPVTGAWTATGSLKTARSDHTATLFPGGWVLVSGGFDSINGAWVQLSSTELYDPITGKWIAGSSLGIGRSHHTATLLPDGKVLLASGVGAGDTAELYDADLGFSESWRPQIANVTSPLILGNSLTIAGSGFRGVSGGSSGNTQDSSTDYPLVQLRSIESGQTMFLSSTSWSTNSFTSLPVWNFPSGWAMATVFVNGIPSTSSIVNITVPVLTETTLTDSKTLTNGTFQFSFTNSVGALFGVLATTNPALPPSNWTALGGVTELAPGQFQFSDPQAANFPQRFYRLRSP
ncbi:MAG TPA: kelch repeat-containing protein [Verrucomicrobiae bacterium]